MLISIYDSDDIYLLDYGSADEDAFSWSKIYETGFTH